jgi:hypothetical protein
MISRVDMEAQVDMAGLTQVERELLRLGVMQWGRSEGSEGSKDLAARVLDCVDRRGLRSDVERPASLIDAASRMSRRDCRRLLLATELAFASESLGWSRDWVADTGFIDHDTITVLRGIQEKLAGIIHGTDHRVPERGLLHLPHRGHEHRHSRASVGTDALRLRRATGVHTGTDAHKLASRQAQQSIDGRDRPASNSDGQR